MLAALRPVPAQQLHHLEQLAELKILLVGDDVEVLIEVVRVVAILRGGEIAGHIQRRAVGAQDDRRGHAVVVQTHDLRALILHQQTLLAQLVDNRLHLVGVEALTVVAVKPHAQHVVHALRVLQRDLLEPVEDFQRLGVAVLNGLEPRAPLVVQRGVFLGLVVEAHVELHHLVHAALHDGLAVAPALVGRDHLAELGAPVAQMVHAHAMVA